MGGKKRLAGEIQIQGRNFLSLKAASEAFGLPPHLAASRLRQGWSLEEALGVAQRKKSKFNGTDVTIKGQHFSSRAAACRALGQNPKTVHMRLQAGRSLEQAFGVELYEYEGKPILTEIAGMTFPSLVCAARYFGIDKYVLNARLNRYGWSLAQALEIEPRPGYELGVAGIIYLITCQANEKKYVGITMGMLEDRWHQHVAQALKKERHDPRSLHSDIRKFGQDRFTIVKVASAENLSELRQAEVDHVLDLGTRMPFGYNMNAGGSGTRTAGKPIIVANIRYDSHKAACVALGISWEVVKGRLNGGWTPEQAFGLHENLTAKRARSMQLGSVAYGSLSSAAKAHDVSPKLVEARLRAGWTKEQAFGLEPPPTPKTSLDFQGKIYRSERELCRSFGVSYNAYYARRKRGMSHQEALGMAPAPLERLETDAID